MFFQKANGHTAVQDKGSLLLQRKVRVDELLLKDIQVHAFKYCKHIV